MKLVQLIGVRSYGPTDTRGARVKLIDYSFDGNVCYRIIINLTARMLWQNT